MKKAFLEDVLSTISKCFIVLIVIVLICIGLSGIRVVKSGEVAMVLRFGRLVGDTPEEQIHKPGILFCFPYFVDEVVTVPTDNVLQQTVTRHYTDGEITKWNESGYLITGDQNIALISAAVKYVISDPVVYALNVNNVSAMIDSCVSNAMLEEAAHMGVDDILTSGKETYTSAVITEAQRKLDEAEVGVTLQTLELTDVKMPEEVRETYEQVNAATVDASTMLQEAQQYQNTMIPYAESIANAVLAAAQSDRSTKIAAATSDLAEFNGLLEEIETNKTPLGVIRARVYNEKMTEALSKIGKVRLVDDGDSKIFIDWE